MVFDVDVPHVDADEHRHADTERNPPRTTTKLIKIRFRPKPRFHENVFLRRVYTRSQRFHQKRMKIVEMDKVKKKTGVESRCKKSRAA
jgi:hypothetical protein